MMKPPKWGSGAYSKISTKLRDHIEECNPTEFESRLSYRNDNARPFAIAFWCKNCNQEFRFELDDSEE
jgi:hypothetical protein